MWFKVDVILVVREGCIKLGFIVIKNFRFFVFFVKVVVVSYGFLYDFFVGRRIFVYFSLLVVCVICLK